MGNLWDSHFISARGSLQLGTVGQVSHWDEASQAQMIAVFFYFFHMFFLFFLVSMVSMVSMVSSPARFGLSNKFSKSGPWKPWKPWIFFFKPWKPWKPWNEVSWLPLWISMWEWVKWSSNGSKNLRWIAMVGTSIESSRSVGEFPRLESTGPSCKVPTRHVADQREWSCFILHVRIIYLHNDISIYLYHSISIYHITWRIIYIYVRKTTCRAATFWHVDPFFHPVGQLRAALCGAQINPFCRYMYGTTDWTNRMGWARCWIGSRQSWDFGADSAEPCRKKGVSR